MPTSNDTSHEAARVQIRSWRSMGPAQRLHTALTLSDAARQVAAAGIQHRHPDYNDEQVQLAISQLLLGSQLFAQVYPNAQVVP